MSGLFKNFSPKYFGNNPLKPKSNYGKIPAFPHIGFTPGSAPQVNLQSNAGIIGDPKAALNAYPGIFKILS